MMNLRLHDGREIIIEADLLPIMTEKEWDDADAVGATPAICQIAYTFDPDVDEDPAYDMAYADERAAGAVYHATIPPHDLPPASVFEPDDPNIPQQ